ncbi:MAG: TetR/AcrR family transcriptional regulator [Acidimicrobiales bacterium]
MRPASISDRNLLTALTEVVSRFGVEGASLTRLSEASGLKRASLYHRFPGGKDEIVDAVVDHTADRFGKAMKVAYADGDPAERASELATAIGEYYAQGASSCLIIALSVSSDEDREGAARCVSGWSDALENIALDAGLSASQAHIAAVDAVAAIEGALVISATTGETDSFERALASLPRRLTSQQAVE